MSNSIKDALKKLCLKITGKKSNKGSIQEVIDDITTGYEGGKTYTGIDGVLVDNETNEISLSTPKYRYIITCEITFRAGNGYGSLNGLVTFEYKSSVFYQDAKELFDKVKRNGLDVYEWKLGDETYLAKGLCYFCTGFYSNKYQYTKYLVDQIQFNSDKENKVPTVLSGCSMYGDATVKVASDSYDAPQLTYSHTWNLRPNQASEEQSRIINVYFTKVDILH